MNARSVSRDTEIAGLMDRLPCGVCVYDLDAEAMAYANRTLLDWLGLPSFNAFEQTLLLRWMREQGIDPNEFREQLHREGILDSIEIRVPDGQQGVMHLRIRAELNRDFQGRAISVTCFVENVTGAREATHALEDRRDKLDQPIRNRTEDFQRPRERYLAYLMQAPVGIGIVDLQGRVLEVNQAMADLTGYSREELLELRIPMLLSPNDPEPFDVRFARLLQSGESDGTTLARCKNGSDRHVMMRGVVLDPGEIILFAVDVHAQKTAEAELAATVEQLKAINERLAESTRRAQESEQRYRTYITRSPIGVTVIDSNAKILFANASGARMLGYTQTELQSMNIRQLTSPNEPQPFEERLKILLTGGEMDSDGLVRTKDGRDRHFRTRATALPQDEFLIFAVDVHDEVVAQQALQKAVEQLQRSNAELEQFAYVASHDLQEPLRMVGSFTGLLERRYNDQLDDKGRQYIRFAVDGAKRMQGLIDDLLTYSRLGRQTAPLAQTDLNAVVEQAIENLQQRIEQEAAHITVEGPLPCVLGDKTQLLQLFQNLIHNALKFRGDEAPIVHIRSTEEADSLTIAVEDNGIGIPEEFQDQIFTIFQRLHTREEYEGSGIGLAVCRKIAERHGAALTVSSHCGSGTVFSLCFPTSSRKEKS